MATHRQPPTVRDFMIFEEHAMALGTRQREEAWYRMPIFYFSSPLRIYGPEGTSRILRRRSCWTMSWRSGVLSAVTAPMFPRQMRGTTSPVS